VSPVKPADGKKRRTKQDRLMEKRKLSNAEPIGEINNEVSEPSHIFEKSEFIIGLEALDASLDEDLGI
jgi:hypothetical protein